MGKLDLVIFELKHREISRREFLGMVGLAFLAVIGVSPLLEMASKRGREIQDAGAFGSADFGGEAAHAISQAASRQRGGP